MATEPLYCQFLGDWELIPESCIYEQGNAPTTGRYNIYEGGDGLVFGMNWTDSEGEQHNYSFTGRADGKCHAFNGGDLADSISVAAKSRLELNSAAY